MRKKLYVTNDKVAVIEGSTETNKAKLDFGQNDSTESDVVEVDTYAISVVKTDADSGAALKDAVFGVYSNEDCTDEIGQITTGENGVGFLAGLKAGTYYLKEIEAPEGYQLDMTVHTVVVPAVDDTDNNVNLDITNKKDIPDLPSTGGAGTIALTAAGVVLIAGAAAFIVRARKEN
ncbi:SpaA isopeptide-forming pilin-related protein [Olsenella uli]|uniref:SpaA isopeptide-forming pilin-related protein n=1 Tax=Olsenella uli TaxID=133926 RepID=UPI00336BEFED